MSCCGQRGISARPRVPAESWPAAVRASRVEYTGETAILLRGPATGRQYQFSPQRRVSDVEEADARVLIQTGYFRSAL